MYVYLGSGAVVPEDEIIGVFDLDNASSSRITREFLKAREDSGELVTLSDDLPRYFVVTSDGERTATYLTYMKMKRVINV